jgi:putative aldouronate transport system substrate-binding protein
MVRKKGLSLLALVLVLSLVLAACGGKNNESGSEGSNSGTNGGSEAPVELVWYTIGTPPRDLQKVNDEINKLTAEKINATVKIKMLDWGEYSQKMQIAIASGENFDIAFTSSWANDYFGNAKKNAFLAIDDLLKSHGQGIVAALHPDFLEGTKVNGHNYGIPANKELPQQRVFRFNKTFVDKYNLDISGVKTLQDLEPILKTFKENEPTIAPIPAKIAEFFHVDMPINDIPIIGMPLDTTDYKLINVWETDEAKAYLETMHRYYQAGYLPKDVATQKDAGDYFKTGQWLVDVADSQPLADNLWSADAGYEVVSVPMQDPISFNWSVAGSMQAISINSEHPEKAMEFLNLLYTDADLMNMLDFGIQDVHYTKTGDNTKDIIPDSGYGFPAFTAGNLMLTYLNSNDAPDKWEQFQKFNDSATAAPLLGFQVDTSKITSELASLKNTKDAVYDALFSGTVDPAVQLPKAIEKFKENGLDKVMAEIQSQIDAWVASK